MKILYIFALCTFAFSQVSLPIHQEEVEIDTVEYLFSGKVNWIVKELTDVKIINRPITLNDYLDYAEECYNDSFKVHTYDNYWGDINNCYDQTGNLAMGYGLKLNCEDGKHFVWRHKEPTFEGFIEWLKEKQCKTLK